MQYFSEASYLWKVWDTWGLRRGQTVKDPVTRQVDMARVGATVSINRHDVSGSKSVEHPLGLATVGTLSLERQVEAEAHRRRFRDFRV